MDPDALSLIAFFAGVVLIVGHIGRMIRTSMLQKTIRQAMKSGTDVNLLLDKIENEQPEGNSDERIGLVLLALGGALIGYGVINGNAAQIREIVGMSLFPIFVGAVLLCRALLSGRRSSRP